MATETLEVSTPTPAQMRSLGFSADAKPVVLSELAWACFCGFVNLAPDRVPQIQRYAPEETAEAWERVAQAARAAIVEGRNG